MSDGYRLRQSWHAALNAAETHFRSLITSPSTEWKRTATPSGSAPIVKGKTRVATISELSDVAVHRKSSKGGVDIYRVVLDVPTGEVPMSLEPWKAVLATPELRQEWDPAVEESHLVEVFDNTSRICKTKFGLGWPANPRDAVTISRSLCDDSTFIDISTSLPRSLDELAYLRPSPPYVRSNVTLFAWCVQHGLLPQQPLQPAEQPKKRNSLGGRLRVTCFSQHDLRAAWNLTSPSGIAQQLSTMALGLLKTVMSRGTRVPTLNGYGNGVSIERIRFQLDREALTVDYAIIPEDDMHSPNPSDQSQGLHELHAIREQRRLTRSIECVLPSSEGWDVQLSTKASSKRVEQLPWSAQAIRSSSRPSSMQTSSREFDQIVFRVAHSPLLDDHSVLKVRVVIEVSGPSSGLRLNGLPHVIQDFEERDPSSYFISQKILQDVSSTADLSLHTTSSMNSNKSSVASSASGTPTLVSPATERSPTAEKTILSRVRRNYIYFSSLLQEPEAKWKRTTEARGVSITQLDSIDPTLVVYRAEATFVGVGLWDLYGALVSPGAKIYWDKQHEDAILLEDVNELTELWHLKTKPTWPANGRDSVVLKTVYKSPTTIHVFSFSADDPHLFPNVPMVEPNVIRTQVDLQGWAIETLSPTTTSLTLLEQSDPKGWANKTSIPQQMINYLAGIGEFAIKCGGPPVVTRLAGAKANQLRYDHERGSLKVEYEGSVRRRVSTSNTESAINDTGSPTMPVIECEIRCDVDTWASSLDIVVDPPPQSISCLRRHRLSAEGGGLWITLSHDALLVDDERLLTMVRKGPIGTGKEKGIVMVNGTKVQVDVDELPEHEIKSLTKRKRVKPLRIPLDQPPVLGIIRRRRAEWDTSVEANVDSDVPKTESGTSVISTISGWASTPKFSSPLARFFTTAVEQATSTTQQAVAAISPATIAGDYAVPPSSKMPMQYALEALAWIQETHSRPSSSDWSLVGDKGLSVHRRLSAEISPVIPVHKGEKVIEGVSAEELASVLTEYNCQKKWDDRSESSTIFETFGADCRTCFVVSKAGFPFRDRGFYLASVTARAQATQASFHRNTGDAEQTSSSRSAIFYVSASFSPDSVTSFSSAKYNPYALPIGRVFVDGWILETLDPYTTENYAIPSTRCTRLIAVDYAGSIPAAFNSMINATLARSILAVETYIKGISSLPITRLPAAGLVIVDKKTDELSGNSSCSWKLRRRDDNRMLIMTGYAPDERIYHVTLLLTLPSPPTPRSPGLEQTTPRPSIILRSPPSSPEPQQPAVNDMSTSTITTSALSSSTSTPNGTVSSPSRSRERLRSSASVFTLRGEVRPFTDLLLAEIIVDSTLYPGGYAVHLKSRMGGDTKTVPLRLTTDNTGANQVLPIAYNIHTMPSSPLHSSGLNTDRPTRHLLRLTLPTAQYQISTVQDPLTGELQSAPPKPQWLLDLREKGILVDIDIRPADISSKRAGRMVTIDGIDVKVVNEKESLTTLGRDELQDDRISKMALLSRITGGMDPLPDELKFPFAIADDLVDNSANNSPEETPSDPNDSRQSSPASSEKSEDNFGHQPINNPPQSDAPRRTSSGLLSFLNSYPNPLLRLSAPLPRSNTAPSLSSPSGNPTQLPRGSNALDSGAARPASAGSTHVYPLSTVIIIALIAFLIGSLLRSLLSPADFIHVVTDLQEARDPNTGWREIKRLLEVKYIIGGWDFQIAVVRRH